MFTYGAGGSWDTFYNPQFVPALETNFTDSILEQKAFEICGSDKLCLFDVAATGDLNIGTATMESTEEQNDINSLLFTKSKDL